MAPASEVRIWRTIIRVTWATGALAGVVVALIPSVRFLAVVAATVLAGAGAFAFMIWSAKKNEVSLRRPTRIKQTPAATAIILVAALVLGALIGLSFTVVLVLDAPYGLVFPDGRRARRHRSGDTRRDRASAGAEIVGCQRVWGPNRRNRVGRGARRGFTG